MRITWSATAISNLSEIHEYIRRDQPEAARRVAQRILSSVERLSRHPNLGRPGREPGTREPVIAGTPYVVPYRVTRNSLVIVAVLHAARGGAGEREV